MKNYTFKLNNIEEEFASIEVSEMMRKFLEMCEKKQQQWLKTKSV